MAVTAPAITEVQLRPQTLPGKRSFLISTLPTYHYFNAGFRGWRSREDFSLRNQTRNPGKEFPKGMLCLAVMLRFVPFWVHWRWG